MGLSFGPCPFGVRYWLLAPMLLAPKLFIGRGGATWPTDTLFESGAADTGEETVAASTAAKARADADKSFNIGGSPFDVEQRSRRRTDRRPNLRSGRGQSLGATRELPFTGLS